MGGAEDFDEFYAATHQRTVQQVYALLGDLEEARDVTQEAYAKAWDDWSRVGAMADPQAWVRTVAWRRGANRLRHLRVAARHRLLRSPPPATRPHLSTLVLVDALRRLPPDQRRALVLHYLVDLPVEQVARETDASVDAVKSRLARGRAALLGLLEDGHPEERYV